VNTVLELAEVDLVGQCMKSANVHRHLSVFTLLERRKEAVVHIRGETMIGLGKGIVLATMWLCVTYFLLERRDIDPAAWFIGAGIVTVICLACD